MDKSDPELLSDQEIDIDDIAELPHKIPRIETPEIAAGQMEFDGPTPEVTETPEASETPDKDVVPVPAKVEPPAPRIIRVGDKCNAVWKEDGKERLQNPVEIIDIRIPSEDKKEYYVHWTEFNKRLDVWLPESELIFPKGDEKKKHRGESISRSTRNKRKSNVIETPADIGRMSVLEKEQEEITKVKNIGKIEIGKYEIETWYFSPYPEEFAHCERLYLCEFCLKYMKMRPTLLRHKQKCTLRHPPGNEIYRDGKLSFWEVDGKKNKIYCQNLCLLSKLFLDHKTLYYDVEPFLFYILTEYDEHGCHLIGYFSKEKNSPDEYNLACIMTLPPHQKCGYGKYLISFSYELSKRENKVGSPEKPLSDLGLLSYRSYWTGVLLEILHKHQGKLSVKEISQMTSIKPSDIVTTLQTLQLIKYWKGNHILSVTPKVIEEHLKLRAKQKLVINPKLLHWVPPTFGPDATKK